MKRNIFLLITVTICLIIAMSILLPACLTKEVVPLPMGSGVAILAKGGEITTSTKLAVLPYQQIKKLYDFYHFTDLSRFHCDEVFRDATLAPTDSFYVASKRELEKGEQPDDGRDTRLRSVGFNVNMFGGHYKRVESLNEQEKKDVVFFDGRKKFSLSDDEIVVSKYAYLTLYVDQFGLEIDEETLYRIIDDEDVFAKYVILRNCPGYGNGLFIDGVAMEYYGLDKQVEEKPIYVQTAYSVYDERKEEIIDCTPTKKVVGYYNVDCSDLAGHKTDINNVYGYNMDGYRSAELYEMLFELVKLKNRGSELFFFSYDVVTSPYYSEEDGMAIFLDPYGILNYEADYEMFALRHDSMRIGSEIKEVTGTYRQKLEKASCIYGN